MSDDLGLFEDERLRKVVGHRDSERLAIAYRNVFDGQDGRIVFEDLANFACFVSPCHVSGDPCSTAFNEGMRNLFLRIFYLSGHTIQEDIYDREQRSRKPGASNGDTGSGSSGSGSCTSSGK